MLTRLLWRSSRSLPAARNDWFWCPGCVYWWAHPFFINFAQTDIAVAKQPVPPPHWKPGYYPFNAPVYGPDGNNYFCALPGGLRSTSFYTEKSQGKWVQVGSGGSTPYPSPGSGILSIGGWSVEDPQLTAYSIVNPLTNAMQFTLYGVYTKMDVQGTVTFAVRKDGVNVGGLNLCAAATGAAVYYAASAPVVFVAGEVLDILPSVVSSSPIATRLYINFDIGA